MKRFTATILALCLAIAGGLAAAMPVFAQTAAEKAAQKALDIAEINNLMGLHAWYHSAFLNSLELEKIWVKHTPDPVWAQNSNYWKGMDAIKAYYGPKSSMEQRKSQIQFHTITSGVVEIAEDRKTAKGVWYTPGVIGGAGNKMGLWERYGIDFVNEDGQWKIWHLHVYTDFAYSMSGGSGGGMGAPGAGGPPSGGGAPGGGAPGGAAPGGGAQAEGGAPGAGAPAGGGPGGQSAERFGSEGQNNAGAAQLKNTSSGKNDGYPEVGSDSYAILMPRPPEPYKTFSETWSYADEHEYQKAYDYTKANGSDAK